VRWVESTSRDGALVALSFSNEADRIAWSAQLREAGADSAATVPFDAAGEPVTSSDWLVTEALDGGDRVAWLRGNDRGEPAPAIRTARPPFVRHEILSRSESGLHFVRERKSGILRQLTEEELHDFSDPAPCAECGEQFGCDHFNCAGERLLTDAEIAGAVPPQWIAFAREAGISREDLGRLRSIRESAGEYALAPDAESDMRMLELVLLLNEAR